MDVAKINIQVNFQQIIEAVKQLSPKEKLQLNELIWDENTPIPIEHQQLVMSRIKMAKKIRNLCWIGTRFLRNCLNE
jgi:hypothetical protein